MYENYIREKLADNGYQLGDEAYKLKGTFFAVSHALSYVDDKNKEFWEKIIEVEGKYG